MKIHCSASPCPIILSSTCVFYEGPNLIYLGINTNTSIEAALVQLNTIIHDNDIVYVLPIASTTILGGVKIDGTTVQLNGNHQLYVSTAYRSDTWVPSFAELSSHPTTTSGYGLPNYPTTLPASDVYAWAKVSVKPSYTTSEVSEGTNLYYTNARVAANSAVVLNTAKVTNATHTGDVTGSTVLTLATVNSNIGTFNNITINAKGLATGGSNVSYVTGTPWTSNGYLINSNNLSDVSNASTARTNLGLAIGTNVLAYRTFGTAANNNTGDFYLSTNPSGYTANTGTVTSVAALTLGTTGTDLSSSVVNGTTTPVITLQVPTASATNRGALSSADWSTFNSKQPAGSYLTSLSGAVLITDIGTTVLAQRTFGTAANSSTTDFEVPLTFSTGLTRTVNTIIVNTTQNILKLSNLISNGFIKTSGGDGTLLIDTNTYLTTISGITAGGDLTGTYPNPSLVNSAVTGQALTGLNLTSGNTITSTDTILQAFGKTQNQISALIGGVMWEGIWNATTNIPALTSSVGTKGYYYIVSVAGTTNLDGITDWQIGDWVIFNGTTWSKVDNTDAVSLVNGYTGTVSLVTGDILEGAGSIGGRPSQLYYTDARARNAISFTAGSGAYNSTTGVLNIPTNTNQLTNGAGFITTGTISGVSLGSNLYTLTIGTGLSGTSYNGSANITIASTITQYTDTLARSAISLTVLGSSGASTYSNLTGVLNIPTYTLSGLGGISLSALSATSPIFYNSSTGVISSQSSNTTTDGYLTSTDWNTFNGKEPAFSKNTGFNKNFGTTTGTVLEGSATAVNSSLLESHNAAYFQTALTNPITGTGTSGYLSKWTGTSTQDNSGLYTDGTNFGIGTTGPGARLDVLSSGTTDGTTIGFFRRSDSRNSVVINNATTATLGGTQVLDVGASAGGVSAVFSGNVGIGTTNPGQKLDVAGNININTNGTNALFSTYKGTNSDGYNIWIGGGGQSSIGAVGAPYQGSYNTANGYASLLNNTTGNNNTANGVYSLLNNTTGNNNTANGVYSLFSNTTGNNNTANGYASLLNNTTGNNNTANGVYSLFSNTTGYQNTANGFYSGRYIAGGTANQTSYNSTYFGYDTRALADGDFNETVIGYGAIGNGSNSVTLGNTSVTKTLLNGNVGIGTTGPNAKQENLSTTEQLRLSYDATHYASFTTASSGDLTLGGTTGNVSIPSTTASTSTSTGALTIGGGLGVGGAGNFGSSITATSLAIKGATSGTATIAVPSVAGTPTLTLPTTTGTLALTSDIPSATSGTYTPTATNVTNITSSTPNNATYTRVGNMVTVFGTITLTNTLAIASEVDITLPVASNLAAATDLNGTGTMDSTASVNLYIKGDSANDRASIYFTSAGVGQTSTVYYSFQYTVL